MAIVLRGKMKGQTVTPMQWCNDWITVKEVAKVFCITALKFNPGEMVEIITSKDLGYMLGMFEHKIDRFVRRRKCSHH